MIKEIHFANMKGQTARQELTGKDIFLGRNGTGKTTRVQALGLSLLGYVPGNGKNTAETFKLATGQEMTAGLVLNNGFRFSRTFTRSVSRDKKTGIEKVSIGESIDLAPGKGEKNDTQKKARILAEVGNFPVMLDFNEFLTLSDAKRRDFIYSLSPISSEAWTKERIESHLMTTLVPDTLDKEYAEVAAGVIHEAMEQFPAGYEVSDALQAMIDWTTKHLSFWKSKQKDAQGAVRQMADLKNDLGESDRNVNENKAELEKLQEDLIKTESTLARDRERWQQQKQRFGRIGELQELLEKMQNAPVENAPNFNEQIKALAAQKKEVPDTTDELSAIAEKMDGLDKGICNQMTIIERCRLELQSITARISTLEGALTKVGELQGLCVIHSDIRCPKDFTVFDKFIEVEKATANNTRTEINSTIAQHTESLEQLKAEFNQRKAEADFIKRNSLDIQQHNNRVEREILELERQKSAYLNREQGRTDKIAMLQEELTRLKGLPHEDFNSLELLEKQIAGLRERIATLKASVEEKQKVKQTLLLMQQSLSDTRAADYKYSAFKDLDKELGPKGIQGELVKEILEPIAWDISCGLERMGFNYKPYFDTESDTGQEIFQFGWINEKGHKVNFDALSTGQQTIFLAAMMLTIINRAQPSLRALIIDNVNHLDATNFQLMVDGISKLSGSLDNIILAGAVQFPFDAEGWGVWNLDTAVDAGYEVVAANA